mgnify:CR=1 FL=1
MILNSENNWNTLERDVKERESSENFLLQTYSTMIQQLLKEHYVMLEKKLKEKLPFSFAVIFQHICILISYIVEYEIWFWSLWLLHVGLFGVVFVTLHSYGDVTILPMFGTHRHRAVKAIKPSLPFFDTIMYCRPFGSKLSLPVLTT